MPRSRLFGYSVEEDEGSLVITVDGALVESAVRQIRDSAQAGNSGRILSQLIPLKSLYKLMSAEGAQHDVLSLEQILGQNVDQGFTAFETQLSELRATVADLQKET